jgi:predicted SprT family Zn-dependent metalloprotease
MNNYTDEVLDEFHNRLEAIYRNSSWYDSTLSFTLHWMKNTRNRVAGRAFYADNHIELNPEIYLRNKGEFFRTVVHELCHLLQRRHFPSAKQAHGPEWKMIFRSFGYEPSTYHNYNVEGVKRKTQKHRYIVDGSEFLVGPTRHRRIQLGTGRYYNPRTRTPLSAAHYKGSVIK